MLSNKARFVISYSHDNIEMQPSIYTCKENDALKKATIYAHALCVNFETIKKKRENYRVINLLAKNSFHMTP
jgi:hypothetical protein